jgi:hypothetical protein
MEEPHTTSAVRPEVKPGNIFSSIESVDKDTEEFKAKVIEATEHLLDSRTQTTLDHPGMLLGKIQSGKTRAFTRVIGLAFDNSFDIAVVLTKGTVALTDQTVRRLNETFRTAINNDWVEVCEIMSHQGEFTRYELKKKLIIVAKKQIHNLERVIELLTQRHPELSTKRLLLIDDEADYASIGFRTTRDETGERNIEAARIPALINELRSRVATSHVLQVTATPYSLYLQPSSYDLRSSPEFVFKPARPSFTTVLPTYPGYVGGDFYFREDEQGELKAPFVYQEIDESELADLTANRRTGHADGRSFQLSDVLNPRRISVLRRAILNFIVGAAIRRNHQIQTAEWPEKYSFIVHTDTHRQTHDWQRTVVVQLIHELENLANSKKEDLADLLRASFADLQQSIVQMKFAVPDETKIVDAAITALEEGQVAIDVVNSDRDVRNMLDEHGELRRRAPMNIFIGGQALDRGITIKGLIGFYYGRNPGRFQQDTVLQHSRMYGNRSNQDLSVTRFYTTGTVHGVLRRINEFDEVLRDALIQNGDHGIVFIQQDQSQRIVPCAPNKLLLSATTVLRPERRLLPVGFDTLPAYKVKPHTDLIDRLVAKVEDQRPVLISLEDAETLILESYKSFDPERAENIGHTAEEIVAALKYLSSLPTDPNLRNKVYVLVRREKNASRVRPNGRFQNSPDTQHEEGAVAREYGVQVPVLMMFRQGGGPDKGWRSGPFWWPLLWVPTTTHPAVYASETQEFVETF